MTELQEGNLHSSDYAIANRDNADWKLAAIRSAQMAAGDTSVESTSFCLQRACAKCPVDKWLFYRVLPLLLGLYSVFTYTSEKSEPSQT